MHSHIHRGLPSVLPSPPHTVGSLPHTLFSTFASPSHSIFQTALCLRCLGRLLSVYNSLSTSSKTYCFAASFSSFSFVSLCPVVFLSLTSSFLFLHHCQCTFSVMPYSSFPSASFLSLPFALQFQLHIFFYCFSAHFLLNSPSVSPFSGLLFSPDFLTRSLFFVPVPLSSAPSPSYLVYTCFSKHGSYSAFT